MSQPTPKLIGALPVPDVVPIQSVDQFMQILVAWHGERIKTVKKLLEVPKGTAFEIGEDSFVLNDKELAGFKFGIELVLMQIGELPFVAELVDAPVTV